jgi:hypothetical protein
MCLYRLEILHDLELYRKNRDGEKYPIWRFYLDILLDRLTKMLTISVKRVGNSARIQIIYQRNTCLKLYCCTNHSDVTDQILCRKTSVECIFQSMWSTVLVNECAEHHVKNNFSQKIGMLSDTSEIQIYTATSQFEWRILQFYFFIFCLDLAALILKNITSVQWNLFVRVCFFANVCYFLYHLGILSKRWRLGHIK